MPRRGMTMLGGEPDYGSMELRRSGTGNTRITTRNAKLLIALLLLAAALPACDPNPVAPPPTPTLQRRFPTPFPPLSLPSEVPAPVLPAVIRQGTPEPAAQHDVPTAAVQGTVRQELQQIEQ